MGGTPGTGGCSAIALIVPTERVNRCSASRPPALECAEWCPALAVCAQSPLTNGPRWASSGGAVARFRTRRGTARCRGLGPLCFVVFGRRTLPGGRRRSPSRSDAYRSRVQSHLEQLEPRQVLAAQFVINEFLAANGAGLVDGFGERPDWIEIRNIGDVGGQSRRLSSDRRLQRPGQVDVPVHAAQRRRLPGRFCLGQKYDRSAGAATHKFLA